MTTQQITRTIAQEMLDEVNEHPHGFIVRVAGREVAIDRVELRGRLYLGHGIDDNDDAFTLVLWAPKTAGYGSRSPRIRSGYMTDFIRARVVGQAWDLRTELGNATIYGSPAHMVRILAHYRTYNPQCTPLDNAYVTGCFHADELTHEHLMR